MTDTIRLDVHAHLIPVDAEKLTPIGGVSWDESSGTMTIDGHRIGVKSLFQPDRLLDWMVENRVEHAFISAPPPLYRQGLVGAETRIWADYINDGLAKIAEESQGRLTALVHLPTDDPALAVNIARQAVAGGRREFAMPSGTGDDRTLGDADFEALWTELDAAKAFVFFHPGECADGRLKAHYLTNLLGNPYESTVALAHLIFDGVLERYPNLVPCFAHGGGLLPMVAGRFQRGYDTQRPGIDTSRAGPLRIVPNILTDCICHSEAAAMHAEATFGAGNLVFGSDWPFPMGLIDPHEQLASYEAGRRRNYFETNPAALLARLDPRRSEK